MRSLIIKILSSIRSLPSSILHPLSSLLLLLASTSPVYADHGGGAITPLDVAFDQKLEAQLPFELTFRDEDGQTVRLGDYFGQKPVILVLAYYECRTLCNVVLNGLLESLKQVTFDLGDDYQVITVSIDPTETPELARAKKESYIQAYGRPGAAEGWRFLTGEQAAIERLAEAVGFHYKYDADTNQYAHPAGIMVLTPQGKIARYFYGLEYLPTNLRLGLVEAGQNKIGSPVDQLLLLCYHYDPVTGQYTPLVTNIVRLAGLGTVLILGGFLFVMFRRENYKKT
jgi:protein SCO1/2